jgi:4-aminobutyrate aminotransferase/diaminobutyrate-pyruvate transaminase/4-aminobutyrate aminotransferase/(S)-3-amino-2-methylpropionate transaminase
VANEYDLTPKRVPHIDTPLRRIQTEIPAPGSVAVLETLARWEPLAMRGQPPILWDHASGFQVYDAFGNCWIDWSSGVLITNAGHGRSPPTASPTSNARNSSSGWRACCRSRSRRCSC